MIIATKQWVLDLFKDLSPAKGDKGDRGLRGLKGKDGLTDAKYLPTVETHHYSKDNYHGYEFTFSLVRDGTVTIHAGGTAFSPTDGWGEVYCYINNAGKGSLRTYFNVNTRMAHIALRPWLYQSRLAAGDYTVRFEKHGVEINAEDCLSVLVTKYIDGEPLP